MDFALPDEHRMIREEVRRFCEEEIEPIAQEIEDEHRFPEEIFDELGKLDMMGVPVSEEYGGLGGDQLMYALVCEELGRVSGSVGLSYAAHVSLDLREDTEAWLSAVKGKPDQTELTSRLAAEAEETLAAVDDPYTEERDVVEAIVVLRALEELGVRDPPGDPVAP
mgnify:CR=1 FL=1